MTENRPIDNDDDDIAYTWTEAQASISQAFKKGLIEIRMREEDGTCIYQPLYLTRVLDQEKHLNGSDKFPIHSQCRFSRVDAIRRKAA